MTTKVRSVPELLTRERLTEIRRRHAASTPGDWHDAGGDVRDEHDHNVAEVTTSWPWKKKNDEEWTDEEDRLGRKPRTVTSIVSDGAFIAHAHQDIPDLLKHAAEMEARLNRAYKALRASGHAKHCDADRRYLSGPCSCFQADHAETMREARMAGL